MEANCAQCHTEENFAGTPHVNRGRQLFYRDELLRLPQDRGHERRHARTRS